MSQLAPLLELLKEISKDNPDQVISNLKTVRELLKKISRTKDHVHIEIDYDGREFHHKVVVPNMSAAEWTSRTSQTKDG